MMMSGLNVDFGGLSSLCMQLCACSCVHAAVCSISNHGKLLGMLYLCYYDDIIE